MSLLRFRDLKDRGIVSNHVTLKRWIEREGFPPGRLLGPNTRVWRESRSRLGLIPARPTTAAPMLANACRRGPRDGPNRNGGEAPRRCAAREATPVHWRCVDCGWNTAPGFPGQGWPCSLA